MSGRSEDKLVFVGLFGESLPNRSLDVYAGYLAVVNGRVSRRGSTEEFKRLKQEGFFKAYKVTLLENDQIIIPGFIDCHTHAPQFPNQGLGLDKPLLEWLKNYTFPLEKKYEDVEFAAKVYDMVVKRLLTNGTTTACYFGTLHLDSTIELAKCIQRHGQRAMVGKVSMNMENDEKYYNNTKEEIKQVETFINAINDMANELIHPIITPRFAVSCDAELMTELGKLALKYDCRVQSHISENKDEISYVLQCNPRCKSYGHVYDTCGLFTDKCVMAHAVHLTPEELVLVGDRRVGLVHCPASNTRLCSGMCPVRKFLDRDIKTGLGTDIAGGDNSSILDAIRRTMDVSTHLDFFSRNASLDTKETFIVNWMEAFYLATLGGARVLNLDDKIGNFEIGKDFDALLIDVYNSGGQIDHYDSPITASNDHGVSLLQRFIYVGDDRNIAQVYVKGKKVKDILEQPLAACNFNGNKSLTSR